MIFKNYKTLPVTDCEGVENGSEDPDAQCGENGDLIRDKAESKSGHAEVISW